MNTYNVTYQTYNITRTKNIQVEAYSDWEAREKAVQATLIDFDQITEVKEVTP